jgi:ribonucleoside-diphosphate reductase alpha chain
MKSEEGDKSEDAKASAPVSAARETLAEPSTNGHGRKNGKPDLEMLARAGAAMNPDANDGGLSGARDQFARFQSDAPACDNCGAITVRNGNCYLCHNCGNSMGCS